MVHSPSSWLHCSLTTASGHVTLMEWCRQRCDRSCHFGTPSKCDTSAEVPSASLIGFSVCPAWTADVARASSATSAVTTPLDMLRFVLVCPLDLLPALMCSLFLQAAGASGQCCGPTWRLKIWSLGQSTVRVEQISSHAAGQSVPRTAQVSVGKLWARQKAEQLSCGLWG